MSRTYCSVYLLLALMASACATPATLTSPSAQDGAVLSSALTAGFAATASSGAALASVRQATADYHDVSKAVAAGYVAPHAGECVASAAGAMGVHSVNPALAADQTIDVRRPEALLYLPKTGGGFRLAAVEYIQAVLVRHKSSGAVMPWFAPTPWPATEYDVVTERPSVLGQAFDGPMPGHEPGQPWHYDLHVWAWAPNPAGDFAPFNPRLTCTAE